MPRLQDIRRTARLLGTKRGQACLAAAYWSDIYPYQPLEYRTPDCRDGGLLDLDSERSVWP